MNNILELYANKTLVVEVVLYLHPCLRYNRNRYKTLGKLLICLSDIGQYSIY